MQYPPVLTKVDFVRRFMRNEFGNKGPNWNTINECVRDDLAYKGLIHIRSRAAGGPGWYDVPPNSLLQKWHDVGATNKTHYLAAMAPTAKTLFQGEVQQSVNGLDLFYSRIPKPMRDSLREGGQHVSGIISRCLIDYYLDPTSRDWLEVLLRRYPDHVVEFSCYSCNWGTIPNLNTVIWEVRGGY